MSLGELDGNRRTRQSRKRWNPLPDKTLALRKELRPSFKDCVGHESSISCLRQGRSGKKHGKREFGSGSAAARPYSARHRSGSTERTALSLHARTFVHGGVGASAAR